MEINNFLKFDYTRRFGVEMEVNAFDGKDNSDRPVTCPGASVPPPVGIHEVAGIVCKATKEYVSIRPWAPTHWDKTDGVWVVKPDGSCGMEVCSPVSKGWFGLRNICMVADALAADERIKADNRCSLHVHVDISDCSAKEVAAILSYWIKCEPVFMDAIPDHRRNNRYCQFIGLCDWIHVDSEFLPLQLVQLLGSHKYLSANTFHLANGKRNTIEFRLAEGLCCLNSFMLKNWVRLILHFVEKTKRMLLPLPYQPNNSWTSYCWLDPFEVFDLLGWSNNELSEGMKQTRNWFLGRIINNIGRSNICIHSALSRSIARKQALELAYRFVRSDQLSLQEVLTPSNVNDAVYGDIYRC